MRLTDSYLARAATGNFVLRVISLSLVFICQVLLARLLGAHGYGLYAYALAWMKALIVPATLGLERLLIREVALYRLRSDWASWHGLLIWARRILLIASVSIAVLAVALSWLIAGKSEDLSTLWLAMGLLPLLALLRVKQFVMQGMHRTIIAQIPEIIVQPTVLITLVAIYAIFVGGLTATGTMGMNVAAACVALVCGAVLLERTLPRSIKQSSPNSQSRRWMRSVVPLLLVSGVSAISAQIPVLVLGAFGDTEAAGILSIAKRFAELTTIPTLALAAALTATLADLSARRDTRGLQQTTIKCARGVTLVSLPVALVFIVFGRPLLRVFGAPFTAGETALEILCVGQIISMIAGANGLLLVMTGHERETAVITTTCAFLNLLFCVALVPRWGMAGAAAGATASLVIWNLWLVWRVRHVLGIRSTIFARLVERPDEAG